MEGLKEKLKLPLIPKRIFLLLKTLISTITHAYVREEDILTADK
jgi:hypothetical protein